mgnify:CR=1 FL=1
MIAQDLDAFENQVQEMALNAGLAFDNMTGGGQIDLLYATSVSFLIVITVAILAALFSYNKCKSLH